jgi:hypothetical protein
VLVLLGGQLDVAEACKADTSAFQAAGMMLKIW